MESFDAGISEELTNHLFEEIGRPYSGMDLVSLNIRWVFVLHSKNRLIEPKSVEIGWSCHPKALRIITDILKTYIHGGRRLSYIRIS